MVVLGLRGMRLGGWAMVLIGSLLAACDRSPSEPCPGPFRTAAPSITPPLRTFSPSPQYTEEARRARLEGTVIVEGIVDCDGSFGNFRVIQSLPLGLTEATLDALSRWRFDPATRNGRPISVWYTVSVRFAVQ